MSKLYHRNRQYSIINVQSGASGIEPEQRTRPVTSTIDDILHICAPYKLPEYTQEPNMSCGSILPAHYPKRNGFNANYRPCLSEKFFTIDCCILINRHSVENSLCRGFTINAKHISVNWFAGRTFVIRSRISSPLLTFTYRDFKLRLLSRLRISHNTQRHCYETITVFDFCGTNCYGAESNRTKICL